MNAGPTFRARVCPEVGGELAELDGVELEGAYLTCTSAGLFNLRSQGGTLFLADGGAVLVKPGRKMLLFQEYQAR